jgi:hypothetical protein
MKTYPQPERLAAKHLGGWCVFVHNTDTASDKLFNAIKDKYPTSPNHLCIGMVGGLAKCDTREEAEDLYEFFNSAPGTRATLYHNGEIQYDD